MRHLLFWLTVPALLAQLPSLDVRRGEQEGTVVIALPGAAVPVAQNGAEWVARLEIAYRLLDENARVLDQAAETLQVRLTEAQKTAMAGQTVRFVRPLPAKAAGAAELRVAMTAQPSGTQFTGTLSLVQATFQVDSNVALIPFQVETPSGGFVTDLGAEEIRLTEDGAARPAEVQLLGRQGPAAIPVDITILHDRSGSMAVNGAYNAEVFRQGLLDEFPNVRIAIYGFSDELVQFTPHTRDVAALNRASSLVTTLMPRSTPLFSSIARTMAGFDLARPAVRILIVLSDGVASRSDLETDASVLRTARRNGVAIYPVLVANGMPPSVPPPPPPRPPRRVAKKKGEPEPIQETADADMRRIAQAQQALAANASVAAYRRLADSGGRLLTVLPTGNSLPALFAEIGRTLRSAYVASYRPSNGTHEVKVELLNRKRGKLIGGVRMVTR